MTTQRLSFVLPVPDIGAAVELWAVVLGKEPTFVDGNRWAQFDHEETRLSLAGTDRTADLPGPMIKADDLEAMCELLRRKGCAVSEITSGTHEQRAVATAPGGWPLVLYAPLPR